MINKKKTKIAEPLLKWFIKHGRKFPWRRTRNPYRIFIAETLLQKTNVGKALPAYLAMIAMYPTIEDLAIAKMKDLKKIIEPLGLVKRAKFLKRGAKEIIEVFKGKFPREKKDLKRIIGIGDYVAHAILCFAYQQRFSLVDTNVARVYRRMYDYKSSRLPYADKNLWELSEHLLPKKKFKEYNLSILDLSALLCLPKDPLCIKCPCKNQCFFYKHDRRVPKRNKA